MSSSSVSPGQNREIAWKFAAYITEKNQMARWAKLLSRYNANAAAMADPEVTALPLIAKSVKAVEVCDGRHAALLQGLRCRTATARS